MKKYTFETEKKPTLTISKAKTTNTTPQSMKKPSSNCMAVLKGVFVFGFMVSIFFNIFNEVNKEVCPNLDTAINNLLEAPIIPRKFQQSSMEILTMNYSSTSALGVNRSSSEANFTVSILTLASTNISTELIMVIQQGPKPFTLEVMPIDDEDVVKNSSSTTAEQTVNVSIIPVSLSPIGQVTQVKFPLTMISELKSLALMILESYSPSLRKAEYSTVSTIDYLAYGNKSVLAVNTTSNKITLFQNYERLGTNTLDSSYDIRKVTTVLDGDQGEFRSSKYSKSAKTSISSSDSGSSISNSLDTFIAANLILREKYTESAEMIQEYLELINERNFTTLDYPIKNGQNLNSSAPRQLEKMLQSSSGYFSISKFIDQRTLLSSLYQVKGDLICTDSDRNCNYQLSYTPFSASNKAIAINANFHNEPLEVFQIYQYIKYMVLTDSLSANQIILSTLSKYYGLISLLEINIISQLTNLTTILKNNSDAYQNIETELSNQIQKQNDFSSSFVDLFSNISTFSTSRYDDLSSNFIEQIDLITFYTSKILENVKEINNDSTIIPSDTYDSLQDLKVTLFKNLTSMLDEYQLSIEYIKNESNSILEYFSSELSTLKPSGNLSNFTTMAISIIKAQTVPLYNSAVAAVNYGRENALILAYLKIENCSRLLEGEFNVFSSYEPDFNSNSSNNSDADLIEKGNQALKMKDQLSFFQKVLTIHYSLPSYLKSLIKAKLNEALKNFAVGLNQAILTSNLLLEKHRSDLIVSMSKTIPNVTTDSRNLINQTRTQTQNLFNSTGVSLRDIQNGIQRFITRTTLPTQAEMIPVKNLFMEYTVEIDDVFANLTNNSNTITNFLIEGNTFANITNNLKEIVDDINELIKSIYSNYASSKSRLESLAGSLGLHSLSIKDLNLDKLESDLDFVNATLSDLFQYSESMIQTVSNDISTFASSLEYMKTILNQKLNSILNSTFPSIPETKYSTNFYTVPYTFQSLETVQSLTRAWALMKINYRVEKNEIIMELNINFKFEVVIKGFYGDYNKRLGILLEGTASAGSALYTIKYDIKTCQFSFSITSSLTYDFSVKNYYQTLGSYSVTRCWRRGFFRRKKCATSTHYYWKSEVVYQEARYQSSINPSPYIYSTGTNSYLRYLL